MSPTHLGEQDASSAPSSRFHRHAEEPGVSGAAKQAAPLRLSDDRVLPGLVLRLRAARRVRPRLHGHQGLRQHQRRPAARARAVRDDVRHHRSLRAVRQPGTRPARRGHPHRRWKARHHDITPGRRRRNRRQPRRQHRHLRAVRRHHAVRRDPGEPARTRPPASSSPAGARSPARRTASRSPATTCRRPASSASPAPSPSTATTASCTPSASWSPGWSRCCWSPNCCATPASSRWPTC